MHKLYRIVHVFQYSSKRLNQIGRNVGYEPDGVSIENNNTVWQSAGVHGDVKCSEQLIARLHRLLARQRFYQTRLA